MRSKKIAIITLLTLVDWISLSLANFKPFLELPQQATFPGIKVSVKAQGDNLKVKTNQLIQQGIDHYLIGELDYAKKAWIEALPLAQKLPHRYTEGAILMNLGLVCRDLGDFVTSFDYFEKAVNLQSKINVPKEESKLLENIGTNYLTLAEFNKAIDFYEKALKISQEINDQEGMGSILSNIALAYSQLNQYSLAIDYYQKSLEIADYSSNQSLKGRILHNRGIVYQTLGQDSDNAQQIQQAFVDYQTSLAIAKEIRDKRLERSVLGTLGLFHRHKKDYIKAIDYYQKSLVIAREIGNPEQIAMALNNLGNNQLSAKQLEEAEKSLREATVIWDNFRENWQDNFQISQFETLVTYILLQRVLVAQERYDEALETAEHGRARAFVNILSQKLSPDSNQPPNLEKIRQIARAQNATLVEYSIIPEQDDKLRHGRMQSQGTPEELYIWVMQPTGKIDFRQVDLQSLDIPLEQLVKKSRESIGVRGRGSFDFEEMDEKSQTQRFQELHKILIEPIAELLPKNSDNKVIFIPHRSLFLVPFPALQDKNGEYLIEKHTILTAPAIQVLDLTREQKRQRDKFPQLSLEEILAVGNPDMPTLEELPEPLSPLIGAEEEAKAIARLFKTSPMLNDKATEIAVVERMPKAKIVHLATHGLLGNDDSTSEMNSNRSGTVRNNQLNRSNARRLELGAIALAPTDTSEAGDGLLTYDEIINLKLNAELVVLSACDTGRGDITGDGVIGLSRSFIVAGAPSVVVSLWSVPDAPTASLMVDFYRNFQKQGLDKAQALRQAMLTTMEQHPSPQNWAAFTLIGEAD